VQHVSAHSNSVCTHVLLCRLSAPTRRPAHPHQRGHGGARRRHGGRARLLCQVVVRGAGRAGRSSCCVCLRARHWCRCPARRAHGGQSRTHAVCTSRARRTTRRVLEVMADDDIALCLTPQAFHNVNVRCACGVAGVCVGCTRARMCASLAQPRADALDRAHTCMPRRLLHAHNRVRCAARSTRQTSSTTSTCPFGSTCCREPTPTGERVHAVRHSVVHAGGVGRKGRAAGAQSLPPRRDCVHGVGAPPHPFIAVPSATHTTHHTHRTHAHTTPTCAGTLHARARTFACACTRWRSAAGSPTTPSQRTTHWCACVCVCVFGSIKQVVCVCVLVCVRAAAQVVLLWCCCVDPDPHTP
jgi:hypothetical protein